MLAGVSGTSACLTAKQRRAEFGGAAFVAVRFRCLSNLALVLRAIVKRAAWENRNRKNTERYRCC